jgi:hypothetical protein
MNPNRSCPDRIHMRGLPDLQVTRDYLSRESTPSLGASKMDSPKAGRRLLSTDAAVLDQPNPFDVR